MTNFPLLLVSYVALVYYLVELCWVSASMFHVIIILNGNVHEVAPIKPVACTLLGFVQNITPHLLRRAKFYVNLPTRNLISDEEKPRTDVFGFFCPGSSCR